MKTNYILLSALFVLSCFTFQLKAQNIIDGINYNIINEGTAVEVAPLPKDGDTDVRYTQVTIVIPAKVTISGTEYPVKKIGNNSLRNNNNMTSLTLPEGLEVIGNSSLAQCESLASVVLPSTVNSIEDWSFYGNSSLESINIPNGVTAITEHTFQNSGLKSIVLPASVTSLKTCAFQDAKNLASINLENIREIGGWALFGTALKNVVISDVESLGSEALGVMPNLETVVLNNVVELKSWALKQNPKLTSVTMTGTEAIQGGVFSGCSMLTSLRIPSTVGYIGDWTFEKTGITKMYASWANPDEDVVIDAWAFGSDEGKIDFKWIVPSSVYWDWEDFFKGYLVEEDTESSVKNINIDTKNIRYTNSELTIVDLDGYKAAVYSIDGRTLNNFAVNSSQMRVPMNLTNGIYILQVSNGSEVGAVKFIVK